MAAKVIPLVEMVQVGITEDLEVQMDLTNKGVMVVMVVILELIKREGQVLAQIIVQEGMVFQENLAAVVVLVVQFTQTHQVEAAVAAVGVAATVVAVVVAAAAFIPVDPSLHPVAEVVVVAADSAAAVVVALMQLEV